MRAQADGHTLLLSSAANAINASLFADQMDFNFMRDIRQVAGITRFAVIVVVQPGFPAHDVAALITYLKLNPGKVTIASSFAGTPPFMAAALFKVMAGIDAPQKPYQSDEAALDDLAAGIVQVHFCGAGLAVEAMKRGRVRALAVTTSARTRALPACRWSQRPSRAMMRARGPALASHARRPRRSSTGSILQSIPRLLTKVVTRLIDLGLEPMPMTPSDFEKFVAAETNKWAKVVNLAGIKTP